MKWTIKHPTATDADALNMLGYIPDFILEKDPRPAAVQIHERYRNGGGWRPFNGFTMSKEGGLKFPGDPEMPVILEAVFHEGGPRKEILRLYPHDWFAIVQEDGTWEASRID